MPNPWIEHVKKKALEFGISYPCAISDKRIKESYSKALTAKSKSKKVFETVLPEKKMKKIIDKDFFSEANKIIDELIELAKKVDNPAGVGKKMLDGRIKNEKRIQNLNELNEKLKSKVFNDYLEEFEKIRKQLKKSLPNEDREIKKIEDDLYVNYLKKEDPRINLEKAKQGEILQYLNEIDLDTKEMRTQKTKKALLEIIKNELPEIEKNGIFDLNKSKFSSYIDLNRYIEENVQTERLKQLLEERKQRNLFNKKILDPFNKLKNLKNIILDLDGLIKGLTNEEIKNLWKNIKMNSSKFLFTPVNPFHSESYLF